MPCLGCGEPTSRDEPPRYDVLKPGVDLDHPETHGPYCETCFASTVTGQSIPAPEPHEA